MLKHEYADLSGIRIHYVTEGEGKLMMFLHGFPEFWYEWKNQLAAFSKDYQVVAPDMRGYNLSSKPAEVDQYRVKYIVDDIHALAEHLGHEKFILVGHDWGGAIAWEFAGNYPDALEKLIIINAPHPDVFRRELSQNRAQQKASAYMLQFRNPLTEKLLSVGNYAVLVKTVLKEGLKKGYFSKEDRDAYIEAWSQPGALTGSLNYYRALRLSSLADESSQVERNTFAGHPELTINVPTLVIWGEKDQYLLPGNLEGMDRFVPDLTVKRVPDGSHWVIHEKPELVNSYIQEFIDESHNL